MGSKCGWASNANGQKMRRIGKVNLLNFVTIFNTFNSCSDRSGETAAATSSANASMPQAIRLP
jgi:hypothetical protein